MGNITLLYTSPNLTQNLLSDWLCAPLPNMSDVIGRQQQSLISNEQKELTASYR